MSESHHIDIGISCLSKYPYFFQSSYFCLSVSFICQHFFFIFSFLETYWKGFPLSPGKLEPSIEWHFPSRLFWRRNWKNRNSHSSNKMRLVLHMQSIHRTPFIEISNPISSMTWVWNWRSLCLMDNIEHLVSIRFSVLTLMAFWMIWMVRSAFVLRDCSV